MTPSTTVRDISHQRLQNTHALTENRYPMPIAGQHSREVPVLPADKDMSIPRDKLLSPETVQQLRETNTKQLLKSNYWFEIANLARWCTTGLIGGTMLTLFSSAYSAAGVASLTEFAALGTAAFPFVLTALTNPLVLGLAAALAVAATVTVKASQHSRKVFVEKSFDVYDTQMQRQAALVGKSVEQAVDKHDHRVASEKSWAGQIRHADKPELSHAARIDANNALPNTVTR